MHKFEQICFDKLSEKGLANNKIYLKRFRWEVDEIVNKDKADYFLNLYTSKTKYPENENNLLVCWLLDIVPNFDIKKDPRNIFTGDLPDIDIDYIPVVREYLKNTWAPSTFGQEYVCNIGNYTTFGIKSALIDMARVHDAPRDEVMSITKNLDDKDEEGKPLTWDSAVRLHPELASYAEKYPDVAEAAKRLMNRNRGMGVHAGGLIVSSIPLHDLVPLVKRKDNPQASAWVEGLHGQELQPVGLVKFDLLVISNLLQIARCCELIKHRHKLDGICNKAGDSDWTDVEKWRNDEKSLAMANAGDLKCIFQFDSEGMRALIRAGGVDKFEDLVAYSALFRPGCLSSGMTKHYVERKKGREPFDLHPIMKPILENTYGVMIFQEQIMQILHVVGDIPLKDCEMIRKAISKKKVETFIKYKQMFIVNGQKNLQASEDALIELFNQVITFSEYGFNLSHAVAYTYISAQLLYLKAHYPHEFYTSMLSCETLSDKIKDYKMEAKIHGVDMHRLDINKSKDNFELQDKTIYFGFSNVKGIGEGPASRIVRGQPYKSFEEFLFKFGTDASVLKPIIGLRCFRDRDPITLWKFTEHYKDAFKKNEDKKKRFEAGMLKYDEEFASLAPNAPFMLADLKGDDPFDDEFWQKNYDVEEVVQTQKTIECQPGEGAPRIVMETVNVEGVDVTITKEVTKYYKTVSTEKSFNKWKELKKIWRRRQQSIERFNSAVLNRMPKLLDFDPSEYDIPKDLAKEFSDPVLCEEKYYGFAWIHELERSPDYKGNLTFDSLRNDIDQAVAPVEVRVKKVVEAKSKKGNVYRQMIAEDVTGQEAKINIWDDDWNRWCEEFKTGNLLRLRLQPPSGGFPTFLLESNQQGKFRGRKKYFDKEDDPRVFVMRFGVKEEEKFMTDDEVLSMFDSCNMDKKNE